MHQEQSWLAQQLLWANVGWGVLNLLPMLPLDGGYVFAGLIERDRPGRGSLIVALVSIAVACGLGWVALR